MAMIESYDFGVIVIDGRKFEGDLIIFPDRIDSSWWRKDGHKLSVDDVQEVVKVKPEILIVGTGYSGMMKVHPATEQYLSSSGIEFLVAKTGNACKTYNALSKSRRVVAALHLTC